MNHIIIKIKSGVVAEVYCAEPVNVIVVDRDVIKGGETFEELMVKAVTMTLERRIRPEEVGRTVQSLVLEIRGPADQRLPAQVTTTFEATA